MTRAPVGERAAYLSPVAACLRGGGGRGCLVTAYF